MSDIFEERLKERARRVTVRVSVWHTRCVKEKMSVSTERAMEVLGIPEDDRELIAMLSEEPDFVVENPSLEFPGSLTIEDYLRIE